jgi:SAM-dependent methyltransferase
MSDFDHRGRASLDPTYAAQLNELSSRRWKRLLNVQAPYRWNLRRLKPGYVLDVGCGLGRNLLHLDGNGVGVDPNPECVAAARARGVEAYGEGEFKDRWPPGTQAFDSLLISHVVEHLLPAEADALIQNYLPFVKSNGKVILIAPQEAGYRRDSTHVTFCNYTILVSMLRRAGVSVDKKYSFPFPRVVGKLFLYNEFVVVGSKRGSAGLPQCIIPRGSADIMPY